MIEPIYYTNLRKADGAAAGSFKTFNVGSGEIWYIERIGMYHSATLADGTGMQNSYSDRLEGVIDVNDGVKRINLVRGISDADSSGNGQTETAKGFYVYDGATIDLKETTDQGSYNELLWEVKARRVL